MYRAVIIDDEKWVIRSLLATIEGQEYFDIVGEAYNGITGLELLEKEQPDLAFIDIRLPGYSGLEILQIAKERELDTLFIVISGHAEFAYAQKALLHNALAYCLKPFSRNELLESMQKAHTLLEQRKETGESQQKTEEETEELLLYFPEGTQVSNPSVLAMLEYINENFRENLTMQDLSDHCNLNANYASQLFRQEVGQTFSSYLTALRLQKALTMLESSEQPVSEIALEVGYRDYFYFARVFKTNLGTTPTAYRENPAQHQNLISNTEWRTLSEIS